MKNGPFDLGGLTVTELGRRSWAEMNDDGAFDAAAQLGYYFMLALFPLLIFLVSLLSTVNSLNLTETILTTLQRVMPSQAFQLIGDELQRIMSQPQSGLVTFGAIGTLWAASSGVASLLGTLNRAYDVEETRGFVKVRAIALGLTVAIAAMIIVGAVLLMSADKIATWVVATTGMAWLSVAATGVNSILGLALMFLGLEVIYYFGPNVKEQKWRWISPGSLVGVALFVLSSVGFSLYVRLSDSYTATYGSIGAVIVLMLWLYLLGLALVAGGEINSEIATAALKRGHPDAPTVGLESTAPASKSPLTEQRGTAAAMLVASPSMGPALPASPQAAASGPVDIERVRETAIRDLVEAMKRQRGVQRAATINALGISGPAARLAIPDLIRVLEDEHSAVRRAVVKTFGRIGEPAVPALVNALGSSTRHARWMAAEALGAIGSGAWSAIPALRELGRDEDATLRDRASRAVEAIELDEATRVQSPIAA